MTLPILPLFKKGANADNIASNPQRRVTYPNDTWTTLKAHGFTHIRIPVEMDMIVPGAEGQADTLSRIDGTVQALHKLGFAMSLCPFGAETTPDAPAVNAALSFLAMRYKPMVGPDRLAFELRNEPRNFTPAEWNAVVPGLVATLRGIVPAHTIILPPAGFDIIDNLPLLTIVDDPNIVYTFHLYEPGGLTQQGAGGGMPDPTYVFPAPPGTPGKTGFYTLEKLAARLALANAWAVANDVPLMMGEFGCAIDALTTTAPTPGLGEAQCVWASAVLGVLKALPAIVGHSWWSIDGREFGVRPHTLHGSWNTSLLTALDG